MIYQYVLLALSVKCYQIGAPNVIDRRTICLPCTDNFQVPGIEPSSFCQKVTWPKISS